MSFSLSFTYYRHVLFDVIIFYTLTLVALSEDCIFKDQDQGFQFALGCWNVEFLMFRLVCCFAE